MNEQEIQQEIQDKGLISPRVLPEQIDDAISSAFYFTAADGIKGQSEGGTLPSGKAESLNRLTFCVIVLKNGFTVTGENSCVNLDNFDAELGKKLAYDNARKRIWELEGYLLRQKFYEESQ